MISLRAGSATDVGLVRTNNQDQLLMADPLYAVADGMGGHAAGEVAAEVAVRALEAGFAAAGATLSAENLMEAAQAANRAVFDKASANPEMRGMGTTLVAIALVEGPQLAIINIGDSRLYVVHEGELRQVTSDHNLVAELVAEGRISKEEAEVHPRRNIMTRALGVEPWVPVDLFEEEPRVGDRYLLCSDGLPREVSDELIASLLRRLADPADAARELVEEAKRRGGNDNITVVVVDVVDSPAGAQPTEPGDTAVVPVVDATDESPAGAQPEPPERKRVERPQVRALNLRVAGFLVLVLLVVGGAAAGVVWYARTGYFVGLRGQQIVIYQGRPGGLLWFKPTLAEVTPHTTADVLSVAVPDLEVGEQETSLTAARAYVTNLVLLSAEARAAQGAPATTAPSTTAPSTTVPPKTTTKAAG